VSLLFQREAPSARLNARANPLTGSTHSLRSSEKQCTPSNVTSRHMILHNAAPGGSAATSSPRQCRAARTASCTCRASRPRSQQQRLPARRRVQQTQAAAADAYAQPAPDAAGEGEALEGVATAVTAYGSALYRFSRPHTLFGTFVSVCSVSSLALVRLTPVAHKCHRLSETKRVQLCVCSPPTCHSRVVAFHDASKPHT